MDNPSDELEQELQNLTDHQVEDILVQEGMIKKSDRKPATVLCCNICGHSDRPLQKFGGTLNSSSRICDACYQKWVVWKGMMVGVGTEFDRQLTLPVERSARCGCGRVMVSVGKQGQPPLWCEYCEEDRRGIERVGRLRETVL